MRVFGVWSLRGDENKFDTASLLIALQKPVSVTIADGWLMVTRLFLKIGSLFNRVFQHIAKCTFKSFDLKAPMFQGGEPWRLYGL